MISSFFKTQIKYIYSMCGTLGVRHPPPQGTRAFGEVVLVRIHIGS